MLEGDANGRIFTFPIPTYSITRDFPWEKSNLTKLWEMTAKYGTPYFSNFVNSDMDPSDVRSMCCRLRLDNSLVRQRALSISLNISGKNVDELKHRGGGLFGANPLTGSIGVVTINMPRLGYLSKNEDEFFERLAFLMDLAKESLEIKRHVLEDLTHKNLYPYSKYYLSGVYEFTGQYWGNHFSTIGIIGMHEACMNFLGEGIESSAGREFAIKVLEFMRERLLNYQKKTNNLYNLEATPAEGTSYRLAYIDKMKFKDIYTSGETAPFYTNSTQLPVNYSHDPFEVLEHQDKLQSLYTGGTVLHIYLGEAIDNIDLVKEAVRLISYNYRLPYFTITPTFSICPEHGYIKGEKKNCPYCGKETEIYSRIVGYYRPIKSWNKGKQEEFRLRKYFSLSIKERRNIENLRLPGF
jgi:ribonucleoside-triphosphate reductase